MRKMYSVQEASEMLGVSTRTVRRWIDVGAATKGTDGLYPVYNLGYRTIRIPQQAVDRLLKRKVLP